MWRCQDRAFVTLSTTSLLDSSPELQGVRAPAQDEDVGCRCVASSASDSWWTQEQRAWWCARSAKVCQGAEDLQDQSRSWCGPTHRVGRRRRSGIRTRGAGLTRGSGAQHVKLGKDFVHPSAESYASLDSRLIDLVLPICRCGAISNLHQIVEGKGQSHMACLPFAGLLGGLLVHAIRGFLFCSPLIKVLEVWCRQVVKLTSASPKLWFNKDISVSFSPTLRWSNIAMEISLFQ